MLNYAKAMLFYFENHFQDIIPCVVMMVSAIIVAIGLLKPVLFDKITNKQVRKVALAFSNVALCFVSALVYFLVEGWNLDYYFVSASALAVCCIITYWFYENTCLRNLIGVVGNIVLRKVASLALVAVNADDINELKTEAVKVKNELKAQTKSTLKKATNKIKEDNDLKGL